MPYTLTMSLLWLVLVAVAGVVVGYLFRGRTSVVPTDHHPAAHDLARGPDVDDDAVGGSTGRPTDADELGRLRQRVERLDTQLSITIAERDKLRRDLDRLMSASAAERDAGSPGAAAVE